MLGSIFRHALQFEAHIDNPMKLLVIFVYFDKFGILLFLLLRKCLFRIRAFIFGKVRVGELLFDFFDVQAQKFPNRGLSVHELRHLIRFGIGNPHNPPDVLDDGA